VVSNTFTMTGHAARRGPKYAPMCSSAACWSRTARGRPFCSHHTFCKPVHRLPERSARVIAFALTARMAYPFCAHSASNKFWANTRVPVKLFAANVMSNRTRGRSDAGNAFASTIVWSVTCLQRLRLSARDPFIHRARQFRRTRPCELLRAAFARFAQFHAHAFVVQHAANRNRQRFGVFRRDE